MSGSDFSVKFLYDSPAAKPGAMFNIFNAVGFKGAEVNVDTRRLTVEQAQAIISSVFASHHVIVTSAPTNDSNIVNFKVMPDPKFKGIRLRFDATATKSWLLSELGRAAYGAKAPSAEEDDDHFDDGPGIQHDDFKSAASGKQFSLQPVPVEKPGKRMVLAWCAKSLEQLTKEGIFDENKFKKLPAEVLVEFHLLLEVACEKLDKCTKALELHHCLDGLWAQMSSVLRNNHADESAIKFISSNIPGSLGVKFIKCSKNLTPEQVGEAATTWKNMFTQLAGMIKPKDEDKFKF